MSRTQHTSFIHETLQAHARHEHLHCQQYPSCFEVFQDFTGAKTPPRIMLFILPHEVEEDSAVHIGLAPFFVSKSSRKLLPPKFPCIYFLCKKILIQKPSGRPTLASSYRRQVAS